MSTNPPTGSTPVAAPPTGASMTQAWMALITALLAAATGPYAAAANALLTLALVSIENAKRAMAQTGELTPDEVTAFDAWLAERQASPEWQVRP